MIGLIVAFVSWLLIYLIIQKLFKPSKKTWTWMFVGWVVIAIGYAILSNLK